MKFVIYIIVYALITMVLGHFLGYWLMMVVWGILGATLGGEGSLAFFSAAIGVGLAWFGQSIWISLGTGSPLPEMMGEIMQLGGRGVVMTLTGLIGFLIGGFSALTGNRFRKLFEKKKPYYFR
ncbi:hypothetical protein KZP23_21855 [Echinicola marina]|uniref:hypothetical protein n=1 Tax=Echinicola marina TaxID=2859768 RepID=UPI001CF6ADFD|nr:hypothetical protein [Echinicola marina]UCS93262.1 hypothetical protein KZP23_21855 [Echinicola marina]